MATSGETGADGACGSTFTFPGMHTVFDCQNPPDIPAEPHHGRRAWKHLHGRWHHFTDIDGDGQRFEVRWEDGPDD